MLLTRISFVLLSVLLCVLLLSSLLFVLLQEVSVSRSILLCKPAVLDTDAAPMLGHEGSSLDSSLRGYEAGVLGV